MNESLDITPGQRKKILSLLSRYLPGVEVRAFGSRVKWTSRPDSDLDMVAFSSSEQKNKIVALREAFGDCSLPFRIDLHVWHELPGSFRENIKAGYVVLQEADPAMKTLALAGESPILGVLDDKIAVNRQMNRTLEGMARAIFKSWFIDFDPVRRNAAGFHDQSSELFPDSFRESELGQVPRGWGVGSIGDFAALIRGQRVLLPGDTVIGTEGPGNSYTLILMDGFKGHAGFTLLRPRRQEDAPFVYLGVTAPGNIRKLSHLAGDGVYPPVRPEVVVAMKIIRPSDEVLTGFSIITNPIFAKIAQNLYQSNTLAEMRDALLPRLFPDALWAPVE